LTDPADVVADWAAGWDQPRAAGLLLAEEDCGAPELAMRDASGCQAVFAGDCAVAPLRSLGCFAVEVVVVPAFAVLLL
jgi:hypothetical protein